MSADDLNSGGYGGGAGDDPRRSSGGSQGRAGGSPRHADVGVPHAPDPDEERLTLRSYLDVLWRRKWMILLLVVVATGAAYVYSIRQPKQYAAGAELIYEKQLDISNPLTGQSYTDANERYVQLASVASIIASPELQERAARELQQTGAPTTGFEVESEVVGSEAGGSVAATSNVVRITATSEDPELAAAAANAYAASYVTYRKETVKTQILGVIEAIRAKLATYQGAARQSTDFLVLQQRLQDLQLLRTTATGNFRVLVPATVPDSPFSPRPLLNALLGLAVGLLLGIGLAFLLEQFDTRVRRTDEVAAILRQPILGRIPRISHQLLTEGAVVAIKHPDGPVAESFRMVRTNLEFLAVDQPMRSVLVTSCVQGEGKSVAVANLAVTLTMTGKKVVVVDADLRRPRQHEYFGLTNERGLSTVASGRDKLFDTLVPVDVAHFQNGQATPDFSAWAEGTDARSRLYVLPSGPIPPNPGEIVASQRLSAIIDQLAFEADIVLVDTPAMLPVGDTSAIAPKVDGLIFLVDMHVIKKPQLVTAAEQLARLPVRMLGAVVRVDGAGGRYAASYGGYGYGSSYTDDGRKGRFARRGPSPAAGQTAAAPSLDRPQPLDGPADV